MQPIDTFKRRLAAGAIAGMLALAGGPSLASQAAGGFPERPITLVVAFGAGGAADVVMRKVAAGLEPLLGASIVVENRAGANGNIGAQYVARAKPDGYTLLAGFPGLASNPSLYRQMSYDPLTDLAPVKLIASAPVLLVANPGLEPRTLEDFIAYARANPNRLRYGSAGVGASGHLAGELFKMVADVELEHVPYKGGVFALNDAMGGQIDAVFDSVPSSRSLVQGGKLRPYAIAGEARSPVLPDVPTFKEAGLDGYYADTWFGVLAPGGTPKPVITALEQAITRLLADPAFKKELEQMGLVPDTRNTEEFAGFLRDETAKWRKVVDQAGISVQ